MTPTESGDALRFTARNGDEARLPCAQRGEGEETDPASLSRVGSAISWVKEGQPKAAVLR